MGIKTEFIHSIKGKGRPQIVLIGNGLERECPISASDPRTGSNQLSWKELVRAISAAGCADLTETQHNKVPFPLLYSLLTTPLPAPAMLDIKAIKDEENRLRTALSKLTQSSTTRLDELKTLGAHHIMTTNYNYALEQSFFRGKDFFISKVRSNKRFNLQPETNNGKQIRETYYRLHTGYIAENDDGTRVGLWHIHGECTVPGGVVLGHDRYGRLLSRIEKICSSQKYRDISKASGSVKARFTSWPQLFLYGDIYIIGLGFEMCEFDLWWLLRRKQRERYGDGRVFFYEQLDHNSVKQKLMLAHGAEIPNIAAIAGDYDDFYKNAFSDIRNRIADQK